MKTDQERAVSNAVIALMKGVVYRESHEDVWATLEHRSAPVRDHFATIGVDVVVDDTEGYAYLRSSPDDEDEDPLPRLVQRRSLSFHVSLLLVILRQRLAEFEANSATHASCSAATRCWMPCACSCRIPPTKPGSSTKSTPRSARSTSWAFCGR